MGDLNLNLSGIAVVVSVILVVVGLVFAIFWYFKKAENLSDEDRLNVQRTTTAWVGATAIAAIALFLMKSEKGKHRGGRSMGSASTLL